jgi:hypothetical protein
LHAVVVDAITPSNSSALGTLARHVQELLALAV